MMTESGQLHAVVAGATGLVGRAVVEELIRHPACGSVTALVRGELGMRHPKLEFKVVDYDTLTPAIYPQQTNAVFCCLGTTIKQAGSKEAFRLVDLDYVVQLARLARGRDIRQFLVVSSLGADPSARVFYNRVKGMMESEVKDVAPEHLSIFRPSLLLGDRDEVRFGEQVAAVLLKVIGPFLLGGLKKYRAISATTVAQAMVTAAIRGGDGLSIYESAVIAKFGVG